jgi:crossover junction endodeoxyribonuclease RusA
MPDEPACRLLLPIPPSTNHLFVNKAGGGRAKAAAYKSWLTAAGWEIKLQRPPALHPPLRTCLRVLIEAPLGQNRDIDNACKPILDVLQKMGVIADDSLVDDLRIVRTNGGGSSCMVSLWSDVMDRRAEHMPKLLLGYRRAVIEAVKEFSAPSVCRLLDSEAVTLQLDEPEDANPMLAELTLADMFEAWLVERWLGEIRSDEFHRSVERQRLIAEWERGR